MHFNKNSSFKIMRQILAPHFEGLFLKGTTSNGHNCTSIVIQRRVTRSMSTTHELVEYHNLCTQLYKADKTVSHSAKNNDFNVKHHSTN